MFRIVFKVDHVFNYAIAGGNLIYSSELEHDRGILRKIDLSDGKLIQERSTLSPLCLTVMSNDNFLAKDTSGNGFLIDNALQVTHEIPSPLKLGDNHEIEEFISVYRGKIKYREFGVYSRNSNQTLWMRSEPKGIETFGSAVFGQSDMVVYRMDPNSGEILWRLDLNEVFRDESSLHDSIFLLGRYKNVLIGSIERMDKLLAIDVDSGKLIWQIRSFTLLDRLDTNQGVIHSISSGYKKVDADTGEEIDSFADKSYFKENGILSQRNNYAIGGDHLITTDYKEGVIGAFNITSHKFDWTYRQNGSYFPSPMPIIYNTPYILVKDSKGTLNIFKKE